MSSEHWDTVYGTKAETAVSWYQRDATSSLVVLDGCAVSAHASVVDVRGGASVLVDALLERGHTDVTVLDISAAGITHARARLGDVGAGVHWLVDDVTGWTPGRTFDVWHDRAVFHFLTNGEDRRRYIERMRAALAMGGLVVMATFATDGPDTCSGLPVQRYDAESLHETLGEDLTVVLTNRHLHRTPWGTEQPFTWLALRAPTRFVSPPFRTV